MSTTNYHLTEPFPAPQRSYTGYGRGGAGNYTKNSRSIPSTITSPVQADISLVSASTAPYPPPKSTSSSHPARRAFTSGRGGWGNSHPLSERAMFSFDEELERARIAERTKAPIYHIGVGGAGNVVGGRGSSVSGSSLSSAASGQSERSFREKVRRTFSRS